VNQAVVEVVTHRRVTNEARCERILAASEPLELADLPWSRVGDVELDAGVIDTLVYMRDVEGFTDSYVAGLGAHRTTLSDPLIRRFLDVWRAEEAGHADAIDRYLQTYASARGASVPARQPAPTKPSRWHERLLSHIGGPFGTVVAAAHMTWGAANELLTLNGYRLLAGECGDPVLAQLLRRIAAQESRHYSFYLLQAEWRLGASRLSRVLLRRIFRRSWTPVGVGEGYKDEADFAVVLGFLGRAPDAARVIDRMDRRFAALPGLHGLRIYRDVMAVDAIAA
jgi:rubrerythrin